MLECINHLKLHVFQPLFNAELAGDLAIQEGDHFSVGGSHFGHIKEILLLPLVRGNGWSLHEIKLLYTFETLLNVFVDSAWILGVSQYFE